MASSLGEEEARGDCHRDFGGRGLVARRFVHELQGGEENFGGLNSCHGDLSLVKVFKGEERGRESGSSRPDSGEKGGVQLEQKPPHPTQNQARGSRSKKKRVNPATRAGGHLKNQKKGERGSRKQTVSERRERILQNGITHQGEEKGPKPVNLGSYFNKNKTRRGKYARRQGQ